jgi:preprotein translocase subunit SecE
MAIQAAKVNNEAAKGGASPSLSVPGPIKRLVTQLMEYPRRFKQFLHEVRVEMKLVTWPTWPDVQATTVVVIVTVAFFAVFFFLVDSGVGYAVQRVFGIFTKH